MMAEFSTLNLIKIKADLIRAHRECSQRRLINSAKWAAELSHSLNHIEVDLQPLASFQEGEVYIQEYDSIILATSYFDLKEYDRAAFFLQECKSPKAYFLHMYARYIAEEKRKVDNASDSIGPPDKIENEHLKSLRIELSKKYAARELDGFCLYLYGVVLKKLDLVKDAMDIFVEALNKEPLHWGTWQELSTLITDREMMLSLPLPSHWMKQLFQALVYIELQLNEDALQIYHNLEKNGFAKSTYILSQIAVAYHNMRDLAITKTYSCARTKTSAVIKVLAKEDVSHVAKHLRDVPFSIAIDSSTDLSDVDQAVTAFSELQKMDPFRLENMDIYSNLLYIKEMRPELAHLAHKCCAIDKYRVETCCVIGNYYSLRSQHEKAVLYFQRSLKLNPHYLAAWTLMGHEYMEMKNTSAAIQAYRQAIEVNRRDYRAWYGLGQTYEILKMPYYCLYYYRMAQQLRPNDSRMIVALGEAYEKLDKLQEAKKCFWKAHSVGDVEETALIKLAKLHERLHEDKLAAGAYSEFINQANIQGTFSYEDQSQAYKYLANFYLMNGQLDEAYDAAQKCAEYTENREEVKAILRQIQQERTSGLPQRRELRIDDSCGSITTDQVDQDHTPIRLSPVSCNLRFNTP